LGGWEGLERKGMDNTRVRIAIRREVTRKNGSITEPLDNMVNAGVLAGVETMLLEKEDDDTWFVNMYFEGEEC